MISNILTSLRETVAHSILYYLWKSWEILINSLKIALTVFLGILKLFSSFPSPWFSLFLLLLVNMVPVAFNIISNFFRPYTKLAPKKFEMSHTGSQNVVSNTRPSCLSVCE